MGNRNFMPGDSTRVKERKYELLAERFRSCLERKVPCEIALGNGGTIDIKDVGWIEHGGDKTFFVTDRHTNTRWDLTTLDQIVPPVRD